MGYVDGDALQHALKVFGYASSDPRPCVVCSRGGLHSLHHIDFKSRGGDSEPSNLAPVCLRHHDAIHAEQLHLVRHDNTITTVTWPDCEIISATPWPPVPKLMRSLGEYARTASEALGEIERYTRQLTAPELVHTLSAIVSIDRQSLTLKRHSSYHLLQRAPRGEREEAAQAFAQEIGVSPASVWGWSREYEVLGHLPDEFVEKLPPSIVRYAIGEKRTPEEATEVLYRYDDKPMPIRAFISSEKTRAGEASPQTCEECLGSGVIPCSRCGGRG